MALLLALSLLSTAFLLSSAAASVTYLKFLRRCAPPSLCGCRSFRAVDSASARLTVVTDSPVKPTGNVGRKISGDPSRTPPEADLQHFRWSEIESLTAAFTSPVIGEGGFSTVFLGRFPDSSPAAVKLHRSGSSDRLLRAFRREIDLLRHLRHPHIVRLLGYCDEREGEGALVFEYVAGGTLRDRLHCSGGGHPLPWARRMSIAHHMALAVEYLHDGGDLPVIHGDITAANVLLDGRRGAVLCDFGSARAGFSEAVERPGTPIVGSPGYADPHYLRTGVVSKKSDVYSFGVVMLELVTGRPAIPSDEEMPAAAAVRVSGVKTVTVDPRLGGVLDGEEVAVALQLAALCVGEQPGLRPSMAEVVRVMTERLSSSISAVYQKFNGHAEM